MRPRLKFRLLSGYDDGESSLAKFAAIKAAGWRGVGFWQASGMWPGETVLINRFDNTSSIASSYCKDEIADLWKSVQKYW